MDEQFEDFMQFCEGYLDESHKKLLALAKKRYHECEEDYKHSQELCEYINCTQTKILREESRFYVHLRDFLSILKENKAKDEGIESNLEAGISKRAHESSESESESDNAFIAKRRKMEMFDEDSNKRKSEERGDDSSNENYEGTAFPTPCDILGKNSGLQNEKEDFQHDDSDEEMERSPDNVEVDEDDEDDEENEIWESEIVIGGDRSESECLVDDDNEIEESEGEDDVVDVSRKEENDSDMVSDSDEINSHGNVISDRVKVSEVSDLECFLDSEHKTCSSLSRAEMLQSETKGTNGIYSSSKDKLNVIGTSSGTDIDNIIKKQGAKKDENVAGNPYSNQSSGRTEINKAKKTNKEIRSDEIAVSGCESDDDDNARKSIIKGTNQVHVSEGLEDVVGTDEDEHNEKVNKEISETSHSKFSRLSTDGDDDDDDDADQSDALKAKKFREKCKKKYVVSVGKKKDKSFTTTSPSKDHLKSNFVHKVEKDRSPRKKHTPQNSPKSKKKLSPNKSPIIIFTDSESDDDIGDIENFKKKFDEKVKRQIQFQNYSTGKYDQSLHKKGQKMEICNNSGSGEDMCHSSKENHYFTKSANGGHITTGDEDKGKQEKKRVNLVTEEFYDSKSDSVFKHHRDNEFGDSKDGQGKDKVRQISEEQKSPKQKYPHEEKLDKEQHKSNEKSPKQVDDEREDVNPGPSSTSDVDNAQKKGSSRQIRKLEGLLESIRNKIEKVRLKELDLDDLDSDVSDYLLEDKLQRKFMKVWDKLCELHKAVKNTGRPTDKYFRYQGTRYPDINRKLEKFINKKKVFPDYHDVRGIIMKVNREKKLHLKSREIDDLSREAFTDIGNQLQKRRRKDFSSTFFPHGAQSDSLSLLDDPALLDIELKKKLDANRKSAKSNMEKVVEKYTTLQYQVGDKTEEESEEEEEEVEPANIDEDLDQLSGVDNTDSDKDNADDVVGTGGKSHDNSWESGPCLEIVTQQNIKNKNLESGQKSTFSSDNPDDIRKLTPVKSALKRDVSNNDNKERHFCEQLGLFRTPTKEGTKNKNNVQCNSSTEEDNAEPALPPPRKMTLLPPRESNSPSKEIEPFLRKDTESIEHCNPLHTDNTSQDDVTVMILSDDEDDELISSKETEEENIKNISCNMSCNISELSPDMTDAHKDCSISLSETRPKMSNETSPKISTSAKISISPKITVSDTESSQSLEKNSVLAVKSEADAKNTSDVSHVTIIADDDDDDDDDKNLSNDTNVTVDDKITSDGSKVTIINDNEDKNTSDVSNVTIITDDEDEEQNVGDDQSLGLKIVSSHHVSLSDISKLHGEEESGTVIGNVSDKGESIECSAVLNSSSECEKELIKLSSEIEEEISKKSSPFSSVSKEKPLNKQKLSRSIGNNITEKINEVLNSEPDVMIIDDVENELLPVCNKAVNTQVQKGNFVRKRNSSSDNIQRNNSNFSKVNRSKNSNAHAPIGSLSTTGFPVSNKSRRNLSQPFRNETSKQSNTQAFRRQFTSNVSDMNAIHVREGSKINSPVAANANILSPVSSKDWHNQSQKLPTNIYKGCTGSKNYQQFPLKLDNIGENTKVISQTSSNIMRSTSNKVQNEFGRTNFGMSKAMAPMNMNSNMKFTSNNSLRVQQQKFGRETCLSNSSTHYPQGIKQVNSGLKANPRSPIRMHSNTHQPYPNTNKNWNAHSSKHLNSVQKGYSIPQCSPRFTASPYKEGGSNVNVPVKRNSSQYKPIPNKGFTSQGQNAQKSYQIRNNGFANSQQRFTCNQNQVKKVSDKNTTLKHASYSSPKVIDDVVIIDCEDVIQIPVKKNKPSKHRVKCATKVDPENEVICIDDPKEFEPSGEESDAVCILSETMDQTMKENRNTKDLKNTESKRTHNSSDVSPSTKEVKTLKENYSGATISVQKRKNEKSTSKSISADSLNKSEETSVHNNRDENDILKIESNENKNKDKMQGKDKIIELNEDSNSKEITKNIEKTSSIETKLNIPDDEEVRSLPDIFEGSLGTVDSNECESIESYHDNETLDNAKSSEEVFDESKKEENSEYDTEESESSEIFTAVKLDTVTVNEDFESTCQETVECKLSNSSQGPDNLRDNTSVAHQKTEFETEMKSKVEPLVRNTKNIEASVEIRTDLVSQVDCQRNSDDDDDEEVSCGMQDEDSISSTSCDVDSHPNVKLGPDIRNKLLQLKKAVVKSKPEHDKRSQAIPQDIIPPLSQTDKRAQWIEEDENASLIETYQEPDSTPYSLEDNQISSSSNENIIVLSDSE